MDWYHWIKITLTNYIKTLPEEKTESQESKFVFRIQYSFKGSERREVKKRV